MRVKMVLCLVALCFASQGCAPLWQAARTSVLQPLINFQGWTEVLEIHRNRELAEAAWRDFVSKHPAPGYSKDFESGFKNGFADYLYSGGTGAPPPVPPRRYWNFKYETPEGHKAIQDWFAGFRAGAESAQESGYRKLVLIPASTCLPSTTTQTQPSSSSSPSATPSTPPSGNVPEELLPPPKMAPNAEAPSPDSAATEPLSLPMSGRRPEDEVQTPTAAIGTVALPAASSSSSEAAPPNPELAPLPAVNTDGVLPIPSETKTP